MTMARGLPETLAQGEDLEAELEQIRPVTRRCLNATVALALLTSATVFLHVRGVIDGVQIAEFLLSCTMLMLMATGIAAIWTSSERRRLRRLIAATYDGRRVSEEGSP
jgi:hypothetical protein